MVISMSLRAIIASISTLVALVGVFAALKRSELDLKRRVGSLEKKVVKLSAAERNRFHRELSEGVVAPRDRKPDDSMA